MTCCTFPLMTQAEVDTVSAPATDHARITATLATHGMCLVTNVLDTTACAEMERLFTTDLLGVLDEEKVTRPEHTRRIEEIRQNGCGAWPSEWSVAIGKRNSVCHRALPHGEFAWAARKHPTVQEIFASIHGVGVKDLATGVDCTFFAPTDSVPQQDNLQWLHVDQNEHCVSHHCVQGVLYVWGSDSEIASTTVIWPGSHTHAFPLMMNDPQAAKRRPSIKIEDLRNPATASQLMAEALAGSRRVPCPAGSLLLWDSRTVHQGWASGARLAQPVCLEPRSRRDQSAFGRKVWMCAAGYPSSHSSSEGRIHGMAPWKPYEARVESESVPPFRPMGIPYPVRDRAEWRTALGTDVFSNQKNTRKNADQVNSQALAAVLRPEVVQLL